MGKIAKDFVKLHQQIKRAGLKVEDMPPDVAKSYLKLLQAAEDELALERKPKDKHGH